MVVGIEVKKVIVEVKVMMRVMMPTILSGNGLLESQITRILVFSDLALSEYQFFRIFLYRKKYNQNTIFSEFLLLGILFIRAVFNLNTK